MLKENMYNMKELWRTQEFQYDGCQLDIGIAGEGTCAST